MMKKAILCILTLLTGSGLFSQTQEEPLTLETSTGTIYGTLLFPVSDQKMPLAIIISGSGPTDRDGNNPMMKNNGLKMLAEGLSGLGIASLRFDKRGIAASAKAGPKEEEIRFETYIEDVRSWTQFLGKDPRFSSLIIIGHSEGSLIGMVASLERSVSKFISLAGIGYPAGDIIQAQLEDQAPFLLDQAGPIIDALEGGRAVDSVPPMLFSLFRPSVQPYLISWFKYDPAQELSKLDKPILIVQGSTDIQVDQDNARQLAQSNQKAELRIFEGMNHILKESAADVQMNMMTYNDPGLPLKEGLVAALAEFINL